jgi:hypothetical protein
MSWHSVWRILQIWKCSHKKISLMHKLPDWQSKAASVRSVGRRKKWNSFQHVVFGWGLF